MRIEAVISSQGAFVPSMLRTNEFSSINPLYFLLDTGAAISAVSSMDISDVVDLSGLEKRKEVAVGVGGILKCYLLRGITLFFLTIEQDWVEAVKFSEMCILPTSTDPKTGNLIILPSILGRDVLGVEFDLYYGRDGVYLEK